MRIKYIFLILILVFLIFSLELIFSPDTLPPYYCCNSTSSTFAGYEVIHSLKWFDDVALSGFIFSFDNCTGNFVNDTWVSFLTISKFNQSASINISGIASTTDQSLINLYLNVNGDGLTWDVTEAPFQIMPLRNSTMSGDTSPPDAWVTSTVVTQGTASYDYNYTGGNPAPSYYHKATSSPNKAASILFITNQTFNYNFGLPASVTLSWDYQVIGNSIATSGNQLNITLVRPDGTVVTLDTVTFNATVNNTWTRRTVNVGVGNFSQPGTYVIQLRSNLVAASKGTSYWLQSQWDNVFLNFTFYNLSVEHNATISYSGNLQKISFFVNFSSTRNKSYNISIYDFSNNIWTSCQNISASANTWYGVWCNVSSNPSNYVSSDKKVRVRINSTMDYNQATLKEEYVQIYVEYYPNESWSNVTKLINSTVGCTIRWRVYANDTSNNWNVSEIFYYKTTTPAYLEVNLITPLPNVITNIKQYSTFWVNASVTCRNGNCGDVIGTIRYNSSSSEPNTPISSNPSTPFYLVNYPSSQSCGTLNRDQSCTLSWLVNVTGDPNTVWKIGVLFSSSYDIQNHTSNATISIFFCTIDFTVAFSNIEFGNVWPSTKGNPAIGNDFNLYNISVNQGSCYLNISISATDLTNSTFNSVIPVNNLKFSNSSKDYSKSYSLSNNFIQIAQNVAPLTNITLYFWLDVPPIYAGYYVGYVYIKGESLEV